MADHKPTRTDGDERATLHALLQYCRESFVRKLDDVDDAAARRRLVPSATTLLWLTQHLAHAEHLWLSQRFAGRPVTRPQRDVAGLRRARLGEQGKSRCSGDPPAHCATLQKRTA